MLSRALVSLWSTLFALMIVACGSSGDQAPAGRAAVSVPMSPDTLLSLVDDTATGSLDETQWQPDGEAAMRGRAVVLNPTLFSRPDTLVEGQALRLNLFDNASYTGRIVRSVRNFADVWSMAGKIPAEPGAWFTLSVDRQEMLGHVYLSDPQRHFVISYSDELKRHLVVERDPAKEDVLPEGPPLAPPDTTEN